MGIVAKVGAALQVLFGGMAEEAADESEVIQRRRIFTAQSLAKTFVLGYLENPKASDEELAQMAADCGASVTAQAIDQRHTLRLVHFLETLFRKGIGVVIGSTKSMAPILERFSSVTLLDSSTITLPDSMKEQFAGCGGSHGGGLAAMKLQTELDIRSGALAIAIEQGRSTDGATNRQHVRRGKGSLRISDLGYFNVRVFAVMKAAGEYFLSRLQFGTGVMLLNGKEVELLNWLDNQTGPFVDQRILLGKRERLVCRLIAWRLPPEQVRRRRQKLRQEMLKKSGKEPSKERLAWCAWTILVTNVSPNLLTPEEAVVMYRTRWQVELLFKRWKSEELVALLSGSTEVRQMVRVWSRLLAALVQHWIVVTTAWGDPTKSLTKVGNAIRGYVARIAAALPRTHELNRVLNNLCRRVARTCRRNKRRNRGTFELLNDVDLLDFSLT